MITEGSRYNALYAEGLRIAREALQSDATSGAVVDAIVDLLDEMNQRQCNPPKHRGELYEVAYRCCKEAAKELGQEKDISERVLDRLSKHFRIEEQVQGMHWSGRRLRIDAIVTPLDDSGWKTKSPSLGIEFKNFRGFNPSFDIKDYTKWWSQCHDYAETDFDGHGYVFVFSYNGFSHYRQRGKDSLAAFAIRFWGRLGVGELSLARDGFPSREGLMFSMSDSKVWSEITGPRDGAKNWNMKRKFGSR